MKKLHLFKRTLLLLALIVGFVNYGWADETVTYTVASTSSVNVSGTAPTGSSATFSNTYSTKEQMTGSNSQTLTLSKYNGYQITGLTLSMKSNKSSGAGKLSYSTDGGETWTYLVGSAQSGVAFSNSAWHGSWSTSYVDVTKSLNIICGTSDIVIKIEATANSLFCQSYTITYKTYDANKVVTPTISISTTTPFVSSKAVTIESETEGATIYYTTDGSTPTTNSTLYNPLNKPVINATTTIKAIAVKDGMTASDVATQTITKETVLEGISGLNVATTSSTATPHYVRLTDAQITYVESSDNGNGFLNDASAGIYFYTNNTLVLNTKYNGIYRITSKTSNSWPEVTQFEEVEGCTSEEASPITPVEMTASDLEENFASNISRQIKIENTTLTAQGKLTSNITIKDDYIDGSLTPSATYTLVGYPSLYNTGKQFRVVAVYSKPAAPTFDPVAGEFSEAFTLHLSCATGGATIFYTTNGDDPTTSSNLYNDATGISIPAASTTVKAIAFYEGMTSDVASATYDYRVVARPQFSPVDGSAVYYGAGGGVTITCATDGATIYYTTNGDTPTASSSVYSSPISITDATTIKAMAKLGDDESSVATASYTIKTPDAPVFSVEEGAVARNTVVNISSREGTTIYYTVDGSDPDGADDSGVNSINVTVTADMTIRAICIDGAANISSETSGDYTIAQVAKPAFSAAAGMVSKGTQLTVTTATEGATIYYTLDGSTPTSSSNVYSGYIQINGAHTVKAIAIKENYIDSEVMSAAYTVAGDSEEFVFKDLGYENGDDVTEVNGTNISLTFAKGTNNSNSPKYYNTGEGARMYNGNTLTIASATENIVAIVFTFDADNTTMTLPKGQPGSLSTVTESKRTWSGDASSIQFSTTATNRIKSISVFFALTKDAATIGSSRFAGFCSEYKVNFSGTGVKAYKAKVNEGKVVLTEIADGIVPANTGVILNGDADDYEIPFTDESATADFSDNQMVGVTQRTQVVWNPTTGIYNYILQQGQFNKANDGYLKANRAYLQTSYNVGAEARALEIVFDEGETTGIDNANVNLNANDKYFNLNGQRVATSVKGNIYIVNGKKVMFK